VELGGTATSAATGVISQSAIIGVAIGLYIGTGGSARVENVTIAGSSGQGIYVYGGAATLAYSTVAQNAVGISIGGGGTLSAPNSIVALNTRNCDGTHPAPAPNSAFVCDDTDLAAVLGLGNRTSIVLNPVVTTQVYPLLLNSSAIDAASGACPPTDQRGQARPVDGDGNGTSICDLGAYEYTAGLHDTFVIPGPTDTPGLLVILPSDTPTLAAAPLAGFNKNANCRKGPGTGYDIVTSLTTGTQTTPDGRDAQSLWLDVLVPNTQAHCWVLGSSVDLNVLVETLAVLPTPPLPDAAGAFIDKADCQVKLKSLSVKLTWSAAAHVTGYHLYRSGNLLQTFGANVTTYTDGSAPLGKDLLYELEAFNANGSSARVQTTVSACK